MLKRLGKAFEIIEKSETPRKVFELAQNYPTSLWGSVRNQRLFESIETYCMFIGYPRSGHTLIGSLLDAHPNMIIGHELNTLKYVLAGYRKGQIFYLLLRRSRSFTEKGRKWSGYSYKVPNQWNGRFKKLQVIGDKKAAGSTLVLRSCPWILEGLYNAVKGKIKFIHVIRNPYDNISTICKKEKKGKMDLEDSIDYYFSLCETVAEIKRQVEDNDIFEFRIESFIHSPEIYLRKLCNFLGLDAPDDYLGDCASIVFRSPQKTRSNVNWNYELIDRVKEKMTGYSFLEDYSYDG
jgi:hypothetical protein